MSKTLQERLGDAKDMLDQVHAALGRHPGGLPNEVETSFRGIVDFRADIEHWLGLIQARAVAREVLEALESRADADDYVPFGVTRVKYQHVRLVGVQAYLTTNWALADRITGMVGRVLCTPDAGANAMSPAQLVSHFVQKDRKRMTAGALFESVKRAFGWPIGVSYSIRNHFVHDGAQDCGDELFRGAIAGSCVSDLSRWLEHGGGAGAEHVRCRPIAATTQRGLAPYAEG